MIAAIEAVNKSRMAVSTAAKKFCVPRKTLADRIQGRVQHGQRPGPNTVLTSVEEDALVSYLFYMAKRGFPLTKRMVKAYAWAIAKRSGGDKRFNDQLGPREHWWVNFKKRHPEVTLRKVEYLERSHAEALNPDVIREYFQLLNETLNNYKLNGCPRQMYNCDETFIPLNCHREKVVTLKGAKNVYGQSQGTTEHITMLCCVPAAGFPTPPMIIYPKAFPGGRYRFDRPDDALYAKSESGWVDSTLFLSWLKKIFLIFIVPQQPVILFVDGHSSHITLDVIDTCRANNIILFCLPPLTLFSLLT